MNAVDTNVLLYSLDTSEPVKQAKAMQIILQLAVDPQKTVLLWQVLAESVNQLKRWTSQGKFTEAEFDFQMQEWRAVFHVVFPTLGVLDHALDLAKRYSLSHWDSMILGACKDVGVTTLYTEDMGAPRIIDGIQLVNPLV
jgi:predicted nucleic acid-binding protein